MSDIFISYSNKDKDFAKRLAAILENQGWSVFWDRKIPAGKTWRDVIGSALSDARCVVVLWSHHSVNSNWVLEEADKGLKRNALIPALIENVEPPLGFSNIQAADLSTGDWGQDSAGINIFLNDIAGILGPPPVSETEPQIQEKPATLDKEKKQQASKKEASANFAETEAKKEHPHLNRDTPSFKKLIKLVGIVMGVAAVGFTLKYFSGTFDSSEEKNTESVKSFDKQALYFETFDVENISAEGSIWDEYTDDLWTVKINQGKYCYTNTVDASAVNYQYIDIEEFDISDFPVSVDVKTEILPDSTPISGGGLIYRYKQQEQAAHYYAFTLTADGSIYFFKVNDIGYNTLYSGKADGFNPAETNTLSMVGEGSHFYLYINNTLAKEIEDDELKVGFSGILAVGIGTHCFDNFSIQNKN